MLIRKPEIYVPWSKVAILAMVIPPLIGILTFFFSLRSHERFLVLLHAGIQLYKALTLVVREPRGRTADA